MVLHQTVTDCVQVDINYSMQGNNAANVLHISYTPAVSLTDFDAMSTAIAGWLTSDWAPLASTEWGVTSLVFTDLNSVNGPRKAYPLDPPISGTATDEPLPASATVAVKFDIGIRGRGTAGRMFWVGLNEAQTDGNLITTATGVAILGALGGLQTAIQAVGSPWVSLSVPHRTVNKLHPNPALQSAVDGFLLTNNLIDVQKDRLPFHKKRKRRITP